MHTLATNSASRWSQIRRAIRRAIRSHAYLGDQFGLKTAAQVIQSALSGGTGLDGRGHLPRALRLRVGRTRRRERLGCEGLGGNLSGLVRRRLGRNTRLRGRSCSAPRGYFGGERRRERDLLLLELMTQGGLAFREGL